jgi:hypothetical protein
MSQPWVIVAVTNIGPGCTINGYPLITAAEGRAPQDPAVSLSIDVSDGPDYEHADPGPRRVTLPPGATSSFALGTNTASGAVFIITAITLSLTGSAASPITLPVQTAGSASAGNPIHLEVTAFVKGRFGPPT